MRRRQISRRQPTTQEEIHPLSVRRSDSEISRSHENRRIGRKIMKFDPLQVSFASLEKVRAGPIPSAKHCLTHFSLPRNIILPSQSSAPKHSPIHRFRAGTVGITKIYLPCYSGFEPSLHESHKKPLPSSLPPPLPVQSSSYWNPSRDKNLRVQKTLPTLELECCPKSCTRRS